MSVSVSLLEGELNEPTDLHSETTSFANYLNSPRHLQVPESASVEARGPVSPAV